MGHYEGSAPQQAHGSGIESLPIGNLPPYSRHESRKIKAEHLGYEVDEQGLEWWQKIAAFQMPWEWFSKEEKSRKKILRDVSFSVESGQMLAVLGSSGSGKTTLLDVISGQAFGGDESGKILVNGENRTTEIMKENSAYVRQNDRLLPHLTVKETLMFVAQLKLPTTWSHIQIKDRVETVIAELGLRHVSDTKVGGVEIRGISGGERRRVSIAVQLLLDPNILFLDEPTSGLDSFTANHLVETLAKLSNNNRIVMLSIHQPRSDIFELFDLIMLLSQGRVVYFGKANEMVDYFTQLGYPCPELTNPCDYYVDLTTVDMKTEESEDTTADRVNQLVEIYESQTRIIKPAIDSEQVASERSQPQPEASERSQPQPEASERSQPQPEASERSQPQPEASSSSSSNSPNSGAHVNEGYIAEMDEVTEFNVSPVEVTTRSSVEEVPPPEVSLRSSGAEYETIEMVIVPANGATINGQLNGHSRNQGSYRRNQSVVVQEEEKAGAVQQFWVLFRRALANNLEDYSFLGVQAIEALAMSLMIGLVFYNLGTDQISIRDRFGLLYIICALYPYMVILDVVGQFHREKNILYFELQDNLYTPTPYFFSKVLSEIPEHTFFIILYSLPVYFMAKLQDDAGNYFMMMAICFIVVYCSRSMAMFASAFMPTYQLSVLLAQALFTMFLLSCGFIFNLENIWIGVQWTSYISYLKWSYQAMCHVEFKNLNFTCELPITQSCIYTGEEALKVYSLDGNNIWQCSLIGCGEIAVFLILFFIGVRFISQKPHEQ